jgi:DNA polymerase (family 10)
VKIAINTDAHSTREFWLVRYGVDQARRAGLSAEQVLNAWPLARLLDAFRR